MTLRRPDRTLHPRATNMSALAAGGSSRYVKIKGGEFICDEGGSANERHDAHSFRYRRVSEPDHAAGPWPTGDIIRRIFRHLRRDVSVSRHLALGESAAVGARRRVPRADLH